MSINYKTILDSIEAIRTAQSIELNRDVDADIFAFVTRENYVCLSVFIYRNGAFLAEHQENKEQIDLPLYLLQNNGVIPAKIV